MMVFTTYNVYLLTTYNVYLLTTYNVYLAFIPFQLGQVCEVWSEPSTLSKLSACEQQMLWGVLSAHLYLLVWSPL